MKIEVWTGQTKAPQSTMLFPVLLGKEDEDRVFLLMQTEGKPHGIDNLKEECMSVLTHAVVEGEGEGYVRLESALKELNGLLKGFVLSDAVRDVHAVVGLLEKDGTLHLSHVGRAEAYVVRDGNAIQVTEYYRGKPPSAFMHIVSGEVQEKDHFIVSTQRLLRSMTPAQLAHMVHQSGDNAVESIVSTLTAEKEIACVLHISIATKVSIVTPGATSTRNMPRMRPQVSTTSFTLTDAVGGVLKKIQLPSLLSRKKHGEPLLSSLRERSSQFFKDLFHPERKQRAHLLLLAGAAAIFLIIWVGVQLSLTSQRSSTREQLQQTLTQVTTDIATAETRQLAGEIDGANANLERAEQGAKQIIANESGLFRSEALDLLDRIKSKREEMNHIIRLVPPRIMANISAKKSDVMALGFIGYPNGEFVVYDRQDLYRVSLNSVENSDRLNADELILDGVSFPRFSANIFLTTGNSIIEVSGDQPTTMKTEDSAGWVTGVDMKTYLRYLYILAPERKQIYKYEHLTNKYGPPSEYNVSGDLTGAIDMTIAGPVFVLRDLAASGGASGDRDVVKLLRGEKQTFTIRNLPVGALKNVSKIYKSSSTGNFYFLDPVDKRIIITSNDGDIGDSLYLKQYILDSDQVGKLKDLYVDAEDTQLYILDDKKVYAVDLQSR